MTSFAPHRETVEAFMACMNGGVDTEVYASLLAEDVVLNGPLGQQRTGRDAVVAGSKALLSQASTVRYEEVFSGATHHCVNFRLEFGDVGIDGMDKLSLNEEGKIAEVTIWWRTIPDAVEMQRAVCGIWGVEPWELRTGTE